MLGLPTGALGGGASRSGASPTFRPVPSRLRNTASAPLPPQPTSPAHPGSPLHEASARARDAQAALQAQLAVQRARVAAAAAAAQSAGHQPQPQQSMTMLAATALAAAGQAPTYTSQEAEELATLLGAAAANAALMQPGGTSAPWSPSSAFTQFPPGLRLGGGGVPGADLWRSHALLQPFMDNPFAQGQHGGHGDGGAGGSRGHRQSLGAAGGGAPNGTGAPSRSGKRKPAGTAGARGRGGAAASGGGGAAERGGGPAGQPPPAKKPRKTAGSAAAAPKAPRKRASGAAGGGEGGAARRGGGAALAFAMPGGAGLLGGPLVPRPTAPRGAPPPLKSLLDDVEAFEESVPDVSKPTCSRSRSWNPEEDETVRALVREHGLRKWAFIAACLKTKTQKQVYARWRDYLQPSLTTKPWTKEEQKRLLELQAQIGNQWAQLAQLMPGRSPNAIKNRFHATKRKLERHTKKGGGHGAGAGPPRAAQPVGAAAAEDDGDDDGDGDE